MDLTRTERIYTAANADAYDASYLRPWRRKDEVNERLLSGLLAAVKSLALRDPALRDPTWHFATRPGTSGPHLTARRHLTAGRTAAPARQTRSGTPALANAEVLVEEG